MLDIRQIVQNPEAAIKALEKRMARAREVVEATVGQYQENLSFELKQQKIRASLNQINKEISNTVGEAKGEAIKSSSQLSEELKKLEVAATNANFVSGFGLYQLPNLPLSDVPVGKDASANVTLREVGERHKPGKFLDYLTLAEKLDIIDVQRGAKVSGSRFGYLKGAGALLEFALVQYAMQELLKSGFVAVVPPVLINEQYMEAMGYLAQGGLDEVYHLEKDRQFLVGTSEQSVGSYHADEIIPESELPKKYAAFSTCFRREAGSYGKDTKGILRVHQFDKVEMLVVCAAVDSEKLHQELLAIQERLVQGLNIPYRVVQLCTGDLGFPSAKTFDIECWLPGQNSGKGEYRETHSTSNTTDYQARALNIRIKGKDGKNAVAYLLNGTAFAIGRTIIAILENYQQPDGSVIIPEALKPFMHGIEVIQKP